MKKVWIVFILLALAVASCTPAAATTPTAPGATAGPTPTSPPTELNVMTHDSFAMSQDVINQFQTEYNVRLQFLKSGDAGALVNRAILTKDAPQADVLYGVDNTFLSRALDAGIFQPYDSPQLKDIPDSFKLDPQNRALPVDYGDVCLNYDKTYFTDHNLPVPQTFEDLLKPEYKGLLVVENPATSSPGLAFLMATIAHFGTQKYLDYWQSLANNGVVVVNGWETAYYTNFSGASGKGPQPLVVSYDSSPAAEILYATTPIQDTTTAAILGPGMCFRQIEFVGILKGTQHLKLAQEFVDFMLGQDFQKNMPEQMFVYPVLNNVSLPEAFTKYAQAPQQAATLDPAEIAKNRDQWIADWTKVVLK